MSLKSIARVAALAAVAAAVAAPAGLAAANGRIVFETDRDAPPYYANLFSAEPDGSAVRRITPTHYDPGGLYVGSSPDYSPDGTRVVFAAKVGLDTYWSAPTFDLFVAAADGSGVTQLTDTPAVELKPAWSPDGTRIAYQTTLSGNSEIAVIPATGGTPVRVTNAADRLSRCGYPQQYSPDWLDADRLVFVSDGPSAGSSCNRDLWTANADGSGLSPLVVSPEWELDPAVSADGSRVAFRRGAGGIWTVRADGSGQRQITFGSDDRPAWSPDGTKIAFQSGRYVDGQAIGHQVWTANADGSNPQPLTRSGQNFDPTWGPALDRTPPSLVCSSPPVGWSAGNVTISCSAGDADSGLANPDDASFTLSTIVSAGEETAEAATGSRTVCDAVGNCATAGPFAGIAVDRRAPVAEVAAPVAGTYLLNASVAAAFTCSDGGSGIARCSTPVASGAPVDTGSVGSKRFTLTAVDGVGNSTTVSVGYDVSYGVHLLYDPAKPTARIRLQLMDANGVNASSAAVAVTAVSVDGVLLPPGESFSYVKHNASYLYRIGTRGLSSGMHTLAFAASGDPTIHTAAFRVR